MAYGLFDSMHIMSKVKKMTILQKCEESTPWKLCDFGIFIYNIFGTNVDKFNFSGFLAG